MTIREQISEMPGEKQIAWLLRVIIAAAVAAGGTISWGALQKLDRISERQAAQTVKIERFMGDMGRQTGQVDRLYDMHYAHGERIRALELDRDWRNRQPAPPAAEGTTDDHEPD